MVTSLLWPMSFTRLQRASCLLIAAAGTVLRNGSFVRGTVKKEANFSAAAERRNTCEFVTQKHNLRNGLLRCVLVQEYLTRMVSQHFYCDDLQPVDHVLYCKNIDPFKCMRVQVSRVKEALKLALTGAAENWLLLRSGIIQSVSCTAAIS
jgi:hypothetical protein